MNFRIERQGWELANVLAVIMMMLAMMMYRQGIGDAAEEILRQGGIKFTKGD
jgi:hypothetical protein